MKIDINYIKQIAEIMEEKSLAEVQVEEEGKKITMKKGDVAVQTVVATTPMVAPAPVSLAPEAVAPVAEEKPSRKSTAITSPMVGTFYAASSPDAEPYVKVGDTIKSGQVVCIIEAMKLMNEIEADVSGKIVEICVENGQTIEFGQVLMYVE